MHIVEVTTKTALVRSRIPGVEYVINPYTGCGHGCRYCYAVFMAKYSKHHQHAPWGSFVEVKANIVDVLRGELARKRRTGTAMLSSVCDPYQPAETTYRLTRGCIEALRERGCHRCQRTSSCGVPRRCRAGRARCAPDFQPATAWGWSYAAVSWVRRSASTRTMPRGTSRGCFCPTACSAPLPPTTTTGRSRCGPVTTRRESVLRIRRGRQFILAPFMLCGSTCLSGFVS
jgi:hypothetical protein